jgi:hypothetical protein
LSLGVNCVYYGLKESILDKYNDLFLSGRSRLFVSPASNILHPFIRARSFFLLRYFLGNILREPEMNDA